MLIFATLFDLLASVCSPVGAGRTNISLHASIPALSANGLPPLGLTH